MYELLKINNRDWSDETLPVWEIVQKYKDTQSQRQLQMPIDHLSNLA